MQGKCGESWGGKKVQKTLAKVGFFFYIMTIMSTPPDVVAQGAASRKLFKNFY